MLFRIFDAGIILVLFLAVLRPGVAAAIDYVIPDGPLPPAGSFTLDTGDTLTIKDFNTFTNDAPFTLTNKGNITGGVSIKVINRGILIIDIEGLINGVDEVANETNALLINNGAITGGDLNNDGILKGTGSIGEVSNRGTIAPGNSIGTLSIGKYSHRNGATLEVEANAAGQADKLAVTGTATLYGGTVKVLAESGNYRMRTTYTILTAGSLTGAFSTVTSNLAFLTPSLSYDANNVYLLLARNSTNFADAALTPNQGAVGAALDRSGPGASGDTVTVLDGLLGLSSTGARSAYDQTGGLSHLALTGAAFTSFRRYLGAVSGRMGGSASGAGFLADPGLFMLASRGDIGGDAGGILLAAVGNAMRAEGNSGGARRGASERKRGFWAKGYGGIGEARGDDLPAKYDYNTAGAVLGFDRKTGPNLLLGLSGGYSSTRVDMRDLPESGRISSWQGSLYAAYAEGAWYANGIAACGYSRFDSSREVSFGDIGREANGGYSGHLLGGYAEGGYRLGTKRADVIPFASLQAARLIREGFTETDAGALDLNVEKDRETSLIGSVGLKARKEYRTGKGTLTPELRAAWLREFSRGDYEAEASFADTPSSQFTVKGERTGRDSALLGAGLGWEAQNLGLFLALDAGLSGDHSEYDLSLGLRYRW